MKPLRRLASEKCHKTILSKIDYNAYMTLKNAYIELGEKYKKLKIEYNNTINTLTEYQMQISEFQQSKNKISEMIKLIKEKSKNEIFSVKKNTTNKNPELNIDKCINFEIKNLAGKNSDNKNIDKNSFLSISRACETFCSTNKNDIIKNNNINTCYGKTVNENILNNYLNTINVGYNEFFNENNSNLKSINSNEEENNLGIINIECEPVPSFILCLKKMNNSSNSNNQEC